MGQAKLRGSFETRKAEGIKRQVEEQRAKAQAELDYWNSLSPEEQERKKAARQRAQQYLALAMGLMAGGR